MCLKLSSHCHASCVQPAVPYVTHGVLRLYVISKDFGQPVLVLHGLCTSCCALSYRRAPEDPVVEEISRQGRLEGCHRTFAATHPICGLESV